MENKIKISIPQNDDIQIESETPITDLLREMFPNYQDFIVLNEAYKESTLEFIEDYRDCKIFKAIDGNVVTREAQRYIVHYDITHPTWEGKLSEVKRLIDLNRDRKGGLL